LEHCGLQEAELFNCVIFEVRKIMIVVII